MKKVDGVTATKEDTSFRIKNGRFVFFSAVTVIGNHFRIVG